MVLNNPFGWPLSIKIVELYALLPSPLGWPQRTLKSPTNFFGEEYLGRGSRPSIKTSFYGHAGALARKFLPRKSLWGELNVLRWPPHTKLTAWRIVETCVFLTYAPN